MMSSVRASLKSLAAKLRWSLSLPSRPVPARTRTVHCKFT